MNTPNFAEYTRKIVEQERRRFILRRRIWEGVVEMRRCPWKISFLLLLLAFIWFVWEQREAILQPFIKDGDLLELCILIFSILIIEIAVLLLLALLQGMGTPRHARQIETQLVHVGLVDRYGLGAVLISRKTEKPYKITTMTFYSQGIPKEQWENRRRAVEDVLNVHYVEDVRYGGKHQNNGNYIVLTVARGASATKREAPLYDDEL